MLLGNIVNRKGSGERVFLGSSTFCVELTILSGILFLAATWSQLPCKAMKFSPLAPSLRHPGI